MALPAIIADPPLIRKIFSSKLLLHLSTHENTGVDRLSDTGDILVQGDHICLLAPAYGYWISGGNEVQYQPLPPQSECNRPEPVCPPLHEHLVRSTTFRPLQTPQVPITERPLQDGHVTVIFAIGITSYMAVRSWLLRFHQEIGLKRG